MLEKDTNTHNQALKVFRRIRKMNGHFQIELDNRTTAQNSISEVISKPPNRQKTWELPKCKNGYQAVKGGRVPDINDCRSFLKPGDCAECGKSLEQHPHETDVDRRPTGYGGVINFRNEEQRNENEAEQAKFLRLPDCVNDQFKDEVYEIMTGENYWAMTKPRLIIEVTGGAYMEVGAEDIARDTLQQGIVLAAKQAQAWIVTGGTHRGVMRLIGDEVTRVRRVEPDTEVICLGIVTWGIIANKSLLEQPDPNTNQIDFAYETKVDTETEDGASPLNSGHNYFLLVDVGKEKIYNQEVNFRAKIISHIARKCFVEQYPANVDSNLNESAIRKQIPVVLLAIAGGRGTLARIGKACDGTNINPVVILTGFGGVSDLIADVWNYMNKQPNIGPDEIRRAVVNHPNFKKIAENNNDSETRVADSCRDCLFNAKKRNLLTVVNSFESQATASSIVLCKSLLNAVFEAKQYDKAEYIPINLETARRWDLPDSATKIVKQYQEQILGMRNDAKFYTQFRQTMREAMKNGQREFVALFNNFNVIKLDDFLPLDEVFALYKETLLTKGTNNKAVSKEFKLLNGLILTEFENPISDADFCRAVSKTGEFLTRRLDCFLSNLFEECDCYISDLGSANNNDCYVSPSNSTKQDEPRHSANFRDAFLLELVMNKNELAIYLWQNGKDLIGTALMASILLSKLAVWARRKNFHDLSAVYKERSREWQTRAKAVLAKCDEQKPERVSWVLTRNLRTWQDLSPLDIAFFGKRNVFTEHSAVEIKLIHIWHGRIISYIKPFWVYFAAMFPIIGIFFLRFLKYDVTNKQDKLVQDTGIKKQVCCARTNRGSKVNDFPIKIANNKGVSGSQLLFDELEPSWNHWKPSWKKSGTGCKCLPMWEAFYELYKSSMVRFVWHTIFTAAFLFLFTSFILTETLDPNGVDALEGVVLGWAACVLLDIAHETYAEGIQITSRLKRRGIPISSRINIFWRTTVAYRFNIFSWKKVDFYNAILPTLTSAFLIAALILRKSLTPENFVYPRTLYVISCWLFWIRSARIFYASKSIGIIVVILSELIPTLLYFLIIYAFFLLSFSAPIYALMAPNFHYQAEHAGDLNKLQPFFALLAKIVYNRWWNLVQVGMDDSRAAVEGSCPSVNDTQESRTIAELDHSYDSQGKCNSDFNFVAVLLYVIFIFITNIAWMNVLIATLSRKVEEISHAAKKLTHFNYMTSVRTFSNKCVLPPPFNILELFIRATIFLTYDSDLRNSDFVEYYKLDQQLNLDEIERNAAEAELIDEAREKQKQDLLSTLNFENMENDYAERLEKEISALKQWMLDHLQEKATFGK